MAMMFNKLKNKEGNSVSTSDSKDDRGGYRTHLIFAGKRDGDGGGGPAGLGLGGGQSSSQYYLGGNSGAAAAYSAHSTHPFGQAQQPMRKPSIQGIQGGRKGENRPPGEVDLRQSNKQVSFGGGGNSPVIFTATGGGLSGAGGMVSSGIGLPGPHHPSYGEEPAGKPGVEVVGGLSRDCFIIPLAFVDRFLPAGLTLPKIKSSKAHNPSTPSTCTQPPGPYNKVGIPTPLNVMEVADPQFAIVVHLMTPLLNLSHPVESADSDRLQRNLSMQLLQKSATERQASHGLLLSSLEKTGSEFPMIALYTVQTSRVDGSDFVETSRKSALETFEPGTIGHCGDHFFHLCREVATIITPTDKGGFGGQNFNSASTGYVVSIFRVFEGDDREKLEKNWLYWTGARTLYRHLPQSVALKRITLHKSAAPQGDKLYLLLCECANFLENVNSAAQLLPALRARLCGYTGIYRVAAAF